MEVEITPGQSQFEFALQPDIFRLEELVVTGQATTIDRRSATTSIASVAGDDVKRVTSPTILNCDGREDHRREPADELGGARRRIQMQIRGTNTLWAASTRCSSWTA